MMRAMEKPRAARTLTSKAVTNGYQAIHCGDCDAYLILIGPHDRTSPRDRVVWFELMDPEKQRRIADHTCP